MFLVLLSVIIFNTVVWFMPKNISRIELYTTSLFAIVLQLSADIFLSFKFKLYWYFNKGVDTETFLVIFGLYPQVNMMFLNFFPYNKRLFSKIMYILGWSVFAVFYEFLIVHSNVFKYGGWKLWYSIPIYPVLYITLLFNHLFVKQLMKSKT